jgi:hypothetical protein
VTPSGVTARLGVIAGLIIDVIKPRAFLGDSDSNDRTFFAAVTQMTNLEPHRSEQLTT